MPVNQKNVVDIVQNDNIEEAITFLRVHKDRTTLESFIDVAIENHNITMLSAAIQVLPTSTEKDLNDRTTLINYSLKKYIEQRSQIALNKDDLIAKANENIETIIDYGADINLGLEQTIITKQKDLIPVFINKLNNLNRNSDKPRHHKDRTTLESFLESFIDVAIENHNITMLSAAIQVLPTSTEKDLNDRTTLINYSLKKYIEQRSQIALNKGELIAEADKNIQTIIDYGADINLGLEQTIITNQKDLIPVFINKLNNLNRNSDKPNDLSDKLNNALEVAIKNTNLEAIKTILIYYNEDYELPEKITMLADNYKISLLSKAHSQEMITLLTQRLKITTQHYEQINIAINTNKFQKTLKLLKIKDVTINKQQIINLLEVVANNTNFSIDNKITVMSKLINKIKKDNQKISLDSKGLSILLGLFATNIDKINEQDVKGSEESPANSDNRIDLKDLGLTEVNNLKSNDTTSKRDDKSKKMARANFMVNHFLKGVKIDDNDVTKLIESAIRNGHYLSAFGLIKANSDNIENLLIFFIKNVNQTDIEKISNRLLISKKADPLLMQMFNEIIKNSDLSQKKIEEALSIAFEKGLWTIAAELIARAPSKPKISDQQKEALDKAVKAADKAVKEINPLHDSVLYIKDKIDNREPWKREVDPTPKNKEITSKQKLIDDLIAIENLEGFKTEFSKRNFDEQQVEELMVKLLSEVNKIKEQEDQSIEETTRKIQEKIQYLRGVLTIKKLVKIENLTDFKKEFSKRNFDKQQVAELISELKNQPNRNDERDNQSIEKNKIQKKIKYLEGVLTIKELVKIENLTDFQEKFTISHSYEEREQQLEIATQLKIELEKLKNPDKQENKSGKLEYLNKFKKTIEEIRKKFKKYNEEKTTTKELLKNFNILIKDIVQLVKATNYNTQSVNDKIKQFYKANNLPQITDEELVLFHEKVNNIKKIKSTKSNNFLDLIKKIFANIFGNNRLENKKYKDTLQALLFKANGKKPSETPNINNVR